MTTAEGSETRQCDHCDRTMQVHKYGEYLCTHHFYQRWREVYGYV